MNDMKKKKAIPTWLSVIFIVLIIVAMFFAMYTLPKAVETSGFVNFPLVILQEVTYVFALVYCFTGYQKDSARYFKIFCILYMVNCLAQTIWQYFSMGDVKFGTFFVVVSAIQTVVIGIFAFAKNLGSKKSFIGVEILILVELIRIMATYTEGAMALISGGGKLVLAIIFGFMIYAKYRDKESRGRDI